MFYIPFKDKERPEQTELFPEKLCVQANTARSLTLRSVSLRRVRLRGVSLLDHQKIKLSTSRSVSQFWIFEKYSIFSLEISSYGSSIACLEMKIFENLKNLC